MDSSSRYFSPENIRDLLVGIVASLFVVSLTFLIGTYSQQNILSILAGIFTLFVFVYIDYGLSQVKNKQKEKLKTEILETPRNIVIIYGKDAAVQKNDFHITYFPFVLTAHLNVYIKLAIRRAKLTNSST